MGSAQECVTDGVWGSMRRGLTLVELLILIAIGGVILAGLIAVWGKSRGSSSSTPSCVCE